MPLVAGYNTLSPTTEPEGLKIDVTHPDVVNQHPSGAGSIGDLVTLPALQSRQIAESLSSEQEAERVSGTSGVLELSQPEVRDSIINDEVI